MATKTLIKPEEIITDGIFRPSNVSTNFDKNLVAPYIAFAEEGNTIGLLGLELYEDMVDKQNTNISNYNPDAGPIVLKFPNDPNYETLWTKFLLRYEGLICVNYALPFIGVQLTPKGPLYKSAEYGENGGIEAIKFLQGNLQKPIDDMEPRLEAWLCENAADYPLFKAEERCKNCHGYEQNGGDCLSVCQCGYYDEYKTTCPNCDKGRESSNGVIFY